MMHPDLERLNHCSLTVQSADQADAVQRIAELREQAARLWPGRDDRIVQAQLRTVFSQIRAAYDVIHRPTPVPDFVAEVAA